MVARGCTEHVLLGRFFEERFREVVGTSGGGVSGGANVSNVSDTLTVTGTLRDADEMNEIDLLVQLALSHYR